MSICTLAAVPAFNSPDEYSHYLRSYEVSRGYLTSEGNGGNDLFSYGRTFNSGLVPEFSAKDHVSLWDIGENVDQRIDREKTQFYGFGNTALYAPTSYLPQAVGIRIADLFTDRPMVLAYAGRIANMLMFGLFFFFAIRLTPVGKNFLVLLGLVPVNIQSANSMSADALALALTVALAAFVLAMRYKQKEVMCVRQLIWMYVLTGFLCLCKVVYMPFCLLLFLIPKERFRSRKNYWFHVVCAGTVILILSFGWLAIASRYLCESQPGVDTAAQLVGILKDPAAFVLTFVRSLDNFGVTYLTEIPFAVHHIPVKDRHGMVFTGKIRFPGEFSRCLPLFHPAFIGRYTSQCMLDGSSPEIRRHLRKTDVKIKAGMVLFRCVNQMFCCIKAFFCFRDHFQFCPHLFIDFRQIADRLTIDFQCLADWDILFSYFHTITGYRLHFLLL